eukprot:c23680_g1_i1 orf=291-1175(-)
MESLSFSLPQPTGFPSLASLHRTSLDAHALITWRSRPFSAPLASVEHGNLGGQVKIRVDNLGKKAKNGQIILQNVSFRVRTGEVHGLIGPSGSGKSTVLRALNRLWEPPRSSVFLDGVDVTTRDVIELRRKVGMVFQYPFLFDGTVAYNVKYGPSLQGKHLSLEEIEDILLRSGFSEFQKNFLTKHVNELSGGEAQRVALARALANKPEVLLLDEPTSSLDPLSTRMVEKTILQLKENHEVTVVLVSHSVEQIARVVDTVTILFQGSLLQTGTLDELKRNNHDVLTQFFASASP